LYTALNFVILKVFLLVPGHLCRLQGGYFCNWHNTHMVKRSVFSLLGNCYQKLHHGLFGLYHSWSRCPYLQVSINTFFYGLQEWWPNKKLRYPVFLNSQNVQLCTDRFLGVETGRTYSFSIVFFERSNTGSCKAKLF